jgi:hypothetical protein
MYNKYRVIKNKKIAFSLIIIIALLVVGVITLLHNFSNIVFNKKITHPTINKQRQRYIPKTTTKSNSPTSTTTTTNNTTPISPTGPSNSNQTLRAPFGSFVSNHSPSLSISSQSYELSSCETTPGASCYIEFINTSGTKITLSSETTDSQGVASWSWNVNSKGFTAGSWRITAVATLNGQIKSTVDAKTLNVQS